MSDKNISVLVSGGGTNLQSLIDAQKSSMFGGSRIVEVISSNPGAYALKRAADNGIDSCVISKKDFGDFSDYSDALIRKLESVGTDLVVLAGFLTIIDEKVYNRYPNRIINIHPSLIPSFCGKGFYGLKVHEAALEKGVKISGATVHFVVPECDAGPIILQKAVEVLPDDTPQTLQKRIMTQAEQVILPEAVRLFCEDRLSVENGKVTVKGRFIK